MPQPTIMIVEDDPEVRAVIRTGPAAESFQTLEAASGSQLMMQLERNSVDLITLDLTLEGEDGLALARQVRSIRNVPIVMITGKGDVVDRIVGLELGADDYIAKPFNMREVIARIRAVLRRYERPTESEKTVRERYAFDRWTIDLDKRELQSASGDVCDLTTAEFNLLALLIKRPFRVYTRDEIMDRLKGHDWTPLDRTIDGLIARLRRKLEPQNETPRLLKTVRGVGYTFAEDVRKL